MNANEMDGERFDEEREWKHSLIGCGSNSFGQLVPSDNTNLIIPPLTCMTIPLKNNSKQSIVNNEVIFYPKFISSGSNLSAAVNGSLSAEEDDQIIVWGSSDGASMQFCTPIMLRTRVTQISCGQSHIGCITSKGGVYTWGSGENGMLGHGNKTAVNAPKAIQSLAQHVAIYISCGAYHTGIIAQEKNSQHNFRHLITHNVPHSPTRKSDDDQDEYLVCGNLYLCGLGKAGQLGLGSDLPKSSIAATPVKLKYFSNNNLQIAKVSCGFHHTLVLAVSAQGESDGVSGFSGSGGASQQLVTKVYSFGWGEHGRLGNGSEQKSVTPLEVKFTTEGTGAAAPFTPIEISAGEQHSLMAGYTANGDGSTSGCVYSWGNNCLGQLGIGNPQHTKQSAVPVKIPLPEQYSILKLAAGGRHSACITTCGKLLTWGWGEEGQLGHNTEKSAFYPRLCQLPRVHGTAGVPCALSLGMAHTMVLLRNPDFVYEIVQDTVSPVPQEVKEPPPVIETPPPEDPIIGTPVLSPVKAPVQETPPVVEEVAVMSPPRELAVDVEITVEEEVLPDPPTPKVVYVQGIKELLQNRVKRIAVLSEANNDELQPQEPLFSPQQEDEPAKIPPEVVELTAQQETFTEERTENDKNTQQEDEDDTEQEYTQNNTSSKSNSKKQSGSAVNSSASSAKYNVFYKDGQDLSNCLIANSARRAEIRKQKKTSGVNSNTASQR